MISERSADGQTSGPQKPEQQNAFIYGRTLVVSAFHIFVSLFPPETERERLEDPLRLQHEKNKTEWQAGGEQRATADVARL